MPDTDSPDGFRIYDAMRRLHPAFYVATGDLVYYDNDDPRATTIPRGPLPLAPDVRPADRWSVPSASCRATS